MASRAVKTGPLWKVSVETSPEAEEAVLEWLERLYAVPASGCTNVETGAVVVSVFVERQSGLARPSRAELAAGLERVRACGLDPGPGRISIRHLRAEDWAESWKRHFKPIEVGAALLLKPSWSRRLPRRGQVVVVLDPGLSFGTGQHPTTAFCLEQIVACRPPGRSGSFLDIGCGSGILAIAAAKLGYHPVDGFDFDPDAVRVARENAAVNGTRALFYEADVGRPPQRRPEQFDLVCANLSHDVLLAQRSHILNRVRPGGRLVLAGVLARQFAEVETAYSRAGWQRVTARTAGEWRSGAFQFAPERNTPVLRRDRRS